jgi:hypothetical protein
METPTPAPQTVRRKFLFSAATGFAMAIIMGYPMTGWLLETQSPREPKAYSTAFRLAKAGVDRGLWQMNQQRVSLDHILAGRSIVGLEGDIAYDDVPGGSYKVKVAYVKDRKEFRVIGTGKDETTGEQRALELVLKQEPDEKGLLQTEWREIDSES